MRIFTTKPVHCHGYDNPARRDHLACHPRQRTGRERPPQSKAAAARRRHLLFKVDGSISRIRQAVEHLAARDAEYVSVPDAVLPDGRLVTFEIFAHFEADTAAPSPSVAHGGSSPDSGSGISGEPDAEARFDETATDADGSISARPATA